MWFKSDAFLIGGSLPKRHSSVGENISPAFKWGDVPDSISELVLIGEDLDTAPLPTTHWVVYKISIDEPGLPEGLPQIGKLEDPAGGVQGKNSFGTVGYQGPKLEKGAKPHRVRFTLFGLDKELDAPAEMRREGLERLMQNHIVTQMSLECLITNS